MSTPAPAININDKKIVMQKPKIKLWRKMIQFTEKQQNGELNGEAAFDEMLDVVVVAFNHPDVTRETVEENTDFDELTAIFTHIAKQVSSLAATKAAQFPNGGTPART